MEQKRSKWIIGIGIAGVLLYLGLRNMNAIGAAISWLVSLFLPLLLGLAFAMILNVPMSLLEKRLFQKTNRRFLHKLRRPLAILLSVLLILLLLAGIIGLIIPELFRAIKIVIESLTDLLLHLRNMPVHELEQLPFGRLLASIEWESALNTMQNWLKDQSGALVNTAVGTIGSVLGGVIECLFGLVFAVYILANKEILKQQLTRLMRTWLPERLSMRLTYISGVARKSFRNFVAGQTLEAVVLGTLCMLGMLLLRIPYPLMVGTLVGVGALVPVIGAFAAAIVGAFIIFTESPVQSLVFLIFLILLQQVDGNFIYPRIMGNRVNLPAMWILAAVTIGGGIAGPIGMLLGVPIASTLYVLLRDATTNKEKKKKED